MLQFYRNLYISPNIEHPERMIWRLRHQAGNLALWLVVPPEGRLKSCSGANQLEIVHCAVLHQKYWRRYYRRHPLLVIGMAEGRWEALQLVGGIMQDCVEQTGGTDLLAFLFPEMQEQGPVKPEELPVQTL